MQEAAQGERKTNTPSATRSPPWLPRLSYPVLSIPRVPISCCCCIRCELWINSENEFDFFLILILILRCDVVANLIKSARWKCFPVRCGSVLYFFRPLLVLFRGCIVRATCGLLIACCMLRGHDMPQRAVHCHLNYVTNTLQQRVCLCVCECAALLCVMSYD